MASQKDGRDFGDLQSSRYQAEGGGNDTRALFVGGTETPGGSYTQVDTMDYVTIATLGNGSDFGNLSVARRDAAVAGSTTRLVFAGGIDGTSQKDTIDYVTIGSTGNATDFGDANVAGFLAGAGVSSSTRMVYACGQVSPGLSNAIEYITIASTGDASDFGDLTVTRNSLAGLSSSTRGVFAGGTEPGASSVMDYITIASTGDATDFGDYVDTGGGVSGCSNGHGGLA